TLFAGGILIRQVFDIPMWMSALVLLIISAFFTMLGGLKAVAYTNVYQMILLIVVSLILVIVGLDKVGGIQMKAMGVETLILSNAAGGMNPDFQVGDLMLISDHINFFPEHPLRGKNEETLGPRFPNMSEVYDRELLETAACAAQKHGLRCHKGVYIGVQGPSLETPAEYRMYRLLGADCVGMSTVPEAIVAHHGGMRCLGISVVTNVFRPDTVNTDSHEEILEAGRKSEERLIDMVKDIISRQ
ncbi:MAG: purine-nucleoside phosphorylase, partial [Bacteroidales bacterium]|nr:purine-nucleoside phosphorylase [Bacteroidales bacterium]